MLRFACAAVLLLTFSSATLADLIVEARETGGDVVFTTSGSLNLTGWDEGIIAGPISASIWPGLGVANFGLPSGGVQYSAPFSVSPDNYGVGGNASPDSRSGDAFTFSFGALGNEIVVDAGYVFGNPIQSTMTFEDKTLETLGINPGDTVWSWELMPTSGSVRPVVAATSSITLRAIAIPEPSAFALLGLIGIVAGGRSWWKRCR